MPVRLDKPWIPLTPDHIAQLPGHLGVYQLADAAGEIVYIGMVGGRSLFGLKGALTEALDAPPAGATQFRCEVTMARGILNSSRRIATIMAVCLWVTSMSRQAALAISTSAESLSPREHERSPHGSGPVRRTEDDC